MAQFVSEERNDVASIGDVGKIGDDEVGISAAVRQEEDECDARRVPSLHRTIRQQRTGHRDRPSKKVVSHQVPLRARERFPALRNLLHVPDDARRPRR